MGIFNRDEFRKDLSGLIEEFGLLVFDVDYPSMSSPTLRVYICKSGESAGHNSSFKSVSLDDCARVSRTISSLLEEQQIEEADQWALEVSSPGINRRLRLPEHFCGAVGERVRISFHDQSGRQSIVGKILKIEDCNIVLAKSDCAEVREGKRRKAARGRKASATSEQDSVLIPLDCIEEARVDFVF